MDAISEHLTTPKTRPLTVADRLPETGDILIDPFFLERAARPCQFYNRYNRCPYFWYMIACYDRVLPPGYVYVSRADGGRVDVPIHRHVDGHVAA